MKKSVEILGLPIISITEGRELGMSKTLLIDAKNGTVAAVTIEDEDWYRGVKLIPYESVIAIGDDAVTVTNSENILKLDEAGDFENLLDENIRVIGTKAITKNGTIEGNITELYIGDDGKIEKCEITAPDGTTSEVMADQISIFGKQVTVIDPMGEKKTKFVAPPTVAPPEVAAPEPVEAIAPEVQAAPEPAIQVAPEPEIPASPEIVPEVAPEPEIPASPEIVPEVATEPVTVPEPMPEPAPVEPEPVVVPEPEPIPEPEPPKPAPPKAEAKRPVAPAAPKAADTKQQAADKATEERHRRFLLGKKAARTIKMDNGIVIVEAGADITEEVLQKAKLANKFIELSMNVQ
ncbi:MAG: PRC-barrel domain-containing protein [Selenomonadaceae bacterium]|nr:PRC-barrel domain-containing protein [Selenomonadaceae bacterium]